MTTIAYRLGVVAADTRMQIGGWVQGTAMATKLHRLPDGSVAAVCGDYAVGWRGIETLRRRQMEGGADDGLALGDNTSVIQFREGGKVRVYEVSGWFDMTIPDDGFCAFGSGKSVAFGAMQMGAGPEKAVDIACMFDIDSGGGSIGMAIMPETPTNTSIS